MIKEGASSAITVDGLPTVTASLEFPSAGLPGRDDREHGDRPRPHGRPHPQRHPLGGGQRPPGIVAYATSVPRCRAARRTYADPVTDLHGTLDQASVPTLLLCLAHVTGNRAVVRGAVPATTNATCSPTSPVASSPRCREIKVFFLLDGNVFFLFCCSNVSAYCSRKKYFFEFFGFDHGFLGDFFRAALCCVSDNTRFRGNK